MSSHALKSQSDLFSQSFVSTSISIPKTGILYNTQAYNYRASQFPKVYLSSTLIEKITQANQYKNLSNTPKIIKRPKALTSLPAKIRNKTKLFGLESVNHNFLSKFSNQTGCVCCKIRSLSYESDFEKLIEETKVKTSLAKLDFDNNCDHKVKGCKRNSQGEKYFQGGKKKSNDFAKNNEAKFMTFRFSK